MAETLITLVIVGIVAAITVPMMMNSTKDREYLTARDKVRSSVSEAIKTISINNLLSEDYTTKEFVEKVLSKYLKIGQICDTAKDCGFPEKIKQPNGTVVQLSTMNTMKTITIPYGVTNGTTYSTINNTTEKYNKPIYIAALDGIHIQLFYNPYCVSTEREKAYAYVSTNYKILPQFSLDAACIFGAYDMNGTKGPNQTGKDIGLFGTFFNGIQSRTVAVLPAKTEQRAANWREAFNYCLTLDKTNYVLPTVDELSLIFLNRKFIIDSGGCFWSSSDFLGSNSTRRRVVLGTGARDWENGTTGSNLFMCVRR